MFIFAVGLPADTELDFTMHLGRTGEVYFVTEVEEEVSGDLEGKGVGGLDGKGVGQVGTVLAPA